MKPVMIVGNNGDMKENFVTMAQEKEWVDVCCVRIGKEAVKSLSERKPGLIIIDAFVPYPDKDNWFGTIQEMLKELKEADPTAKIYFTGGEMDLKPFIESKIGAEGYLDPMYDYQVKKKIFKDYKEGQL